MNILANNIATSSDNFSVVHENLALLVRQTDPNRFNGVIVNAILKAGTSLTDKVWIYKPYSLYGFNGVIIFRS